MGLPDEFLKLEQLRQQGILDNTEFAQAKSALLATPYTSASADNSTILVREAELARIDREWEMKKSQFMITSRGRYGQSHIPSRGVAIFSGLFGGIFGAFWTFMAFSITNFGSSMFSTAFPSNGFNPVSIIGIVFPLFGIVFTSAIIWFSVDTYNKAGAYETAYAAYLERRSKVQ